MKSLRTVATSNPVAEPWRFADCRSAWMRSASDWAMAIVAPSARRATTLRELVRLSSGERPRSPDRRVVWIVDLSRHDADDRQRSAIVVESPADNGGVATETALPQGV